MRLLRHSTVENPQQSFDISIWNVPYLLIRNRPNVFPLISNFSSGSTPSTSQILGLSMLASSLIFRYFSMASSRCPPPLAAGATPSILAPRSFASLQSKADAPTPRRSWPGCVRRWTKFVLVCTEGTKKFWPLYRRYCSHFCK